MARKSIFQHSALISELVTQEQLDDALDALADAQRATEGVEVLQGEVSDEQLADQLVYNGVISSYQAEQLKSGRTKFNLGPYVITGWIGQGGMGQVFKGEHMVLGRVSAIKVLPLDKTTDYAISNFHREIKLQARMDHPNLVRAYDAGHDGKVHFLVTEYVPGRDGEYAYEMHTDHVDCKLCNGKRDAVAIAQNEQVLLCEQRGCNAEYHLGCLYKHDPPLFPHKKESGDAPAPVPNEGDAGNGGEQPSQSQFKVPDGDIFCAKCAEEGSTSVLEKYFDKVDYDRSHYSCSRAYVCAMLEKHMRANPDGNIVERSLAQAKAGIGEARLRPSPRSELWYAPELTAQALQSEGAARKTPPVDDTAECLVGKPVRLYNSLDNEVSKHYSVRLYHSTQLILAFC